MDMDKKTVRIIPSNPDDFERQFAYVDSIINKHRTTAIATVNMESLLTAWEVGQYISIQLKSSHWGSKVVSELADSGINFKMFVWADAPKKSYVVSDVLKRIYDTLNANGIEIPFPQQDVHIKP